MKQPENSSKKPTILCLDDEEIWLDYYDERFSINFTVKKAKSLLEAEKILNSSDDVRVALVDVSLVPNDPRDTGGFVFLDKLQSLGLIDELPTIIITSIRDDQNIMRKAFTEYGVKDVFYKENFPKEILKLEKLVATEAENTYLVERMDEKPKILVVEDEPDWQDMLREILESEGCEVDIAGSYQDAIEKMINSSYHLATIDIRLDNIISQDTRGLQFLETVKRVGLTIDSIVISAVASPEQAAWAIVELGARDFINKSDFRPEKFRRKVRKLLSRMIYFNVSFSEMDPDLSKEVPVLHLGKAYDLKVTTAIKQPKSGFTRTISKPIQEGKFELEVVVHPYDVDVLPGSTQYISAGLGDSSEPCLYTIVPKILGDVEIVIDFLYRTNPLGRMLIKAESIEQS